MAKKNYYDEDFKRTLVELYHNGKTQASLILEKSDTFTPEKETEPVLRAHETLENNTKFPEVPVPFQKLNLLLTEVEPKHIKMLYDEILEQGYTTNTVIHYHAVLHQALDVYKRQRMYFPVLLCNHDRLPLPSWNYMPNVGKASR